MGFLFPPRLTLYFGFNEEEAIKAMEKAPPGHVAECESMYYEDSPKNVADYLLESCL